MEPSPTCPAQPSPLAMGEKRAKVPSGSSDELSRQAQFGSSCVALRPNLRRFALKLTRDADAAEDLVQDTLVRALTKASNYRDDGHSLRAWLFTVMQNLFNSQLRAAKSRLYYEKDPGDNPAESTAPERADIGVIVRDATRAIRALPTPQRAVLLLAAEGLRYEEIAARSGIVKNTVRSSLSRARAKIKRAADENYGDRMPSWESVEPGIYRSYNQYVAYVGGKSRYYPTLQEARDARVA